MIGPSEEHAFDHAADRALRLLDAALNDVDDVEVDLESGILTIEFRDGSRFVVNSHRAARQIWMAAGAQAWHFDVSFESERWTAAKTGEELWACLSEQVGRKLSRPVHLTPG